MLSRRQLLVSLGGLTGVALMPISNGQVSSRDIRQNAIKQSHVFPAAIDTAELADLAVTLDKNNTNVSFDSDDSSASNVTIDTTETQQVTVDSTIPAWASLALFIVDVSIQITVGGSDLTTFYEIRINDGGNQTGTGFTHELPANGTRVVHPQELSHRSVLPSSTITTGLWVWTSSGSNTSNQLVMEVSVILKR